MLLTLLLLSCPHNDPLDAAAAGDLGALKCWVQENPSNVSYRGKNGETPLHVAALNGKVKVVEYLLSKGVAPNVRDKRGRTPLHMAALRGHLSVIEALLKAGADPNARDEDGNTPLHYAAVVGYEDVVSYLVSHGADPGAKNDGNITPCDVTGSPGIKKALHCR